MAFECDILTGLLLHFPTSVRRLGRTQAFYFDNFHDVPTASKNISPCSYERIGPDDASISFQQRGEAQLS